VSKHIEVAVKDGMRAGLNAYMGSLAASGLDNVRARYDELLDMSGRKRFDWYCAQFGADVTAMQSVKPSRARKVRNAVTQAVAPRTIDDEIAQAKARLAELEREAKAQTAKPRKIAKDAQPEVRELLWRPWAIERYGLPTKVGATFTYTSKKRGTVNTHRVVRKTAEGIFTRRAS
jgi:hypothetical protein